MDNTLGGVYIEIRGDLSKLQGDFASAEALAVRAGTGMSQGLNQASVGADKVVFAIGRLAGVVEQQSAQMSLAFQRNIATLANFEQGAGRAEQGIRKVGTASEGTVPQMAAVSGAIRTAFGEQSIRAVERFLTLIPGVGAALQFAFPVIGAIALYEAISRVLDKSDQLKAAEKELADAVTQTDAAMREQSQTVDRIRAKSIGREFGPAAEQEAQARAMRQQALDYYEDINKLTAANKQAVVDYAAAHPMRAPLSMDDWDRLKQVPEVQAKIQANEEKIDELTAKSTAKMAEAYDLMAQSARTRSEEGGKLAARHIELEQQAAQRATEISRQRYTAEIDQQHAAEQQRIAGMVSEYARVVATGQEEIRFEKAKQDEIAGYALATRDRTIREIAAKAGAESAGKSAPEQKLIRDQAQGDTQKAKDEYALSTGQAALDVQKSQADGALKLDELNREVARTLANDVREGWDKVTEAAHRSQEASIEAETKDLQAKTRVSEIEDKSKGETKALEIKRQEIELEGRYAETIFKTARDRIAYLQQIAALEHEEREAKLAGLKAELADADAMDSQVRDLVKIAALKREIALASQEDANASAEAANRTTDARNKDRLGYQIGQEIRRAFSELPQRLGTALADGAFGGKGHNVGKEVADALKTSGKELFGEALSSLIKNLASTILVQTGLQAAFNALFPAVTTPQIAATTANTVAIVANTAAMAASSAVSGASTAVGAAGSVAGAAGSLSSTAASGLVGPLIAAAGGVIGGVISAVTTWIGDNKIVKAVNGTTSAVNATTQAVRSLGSGGIASGSGNPQAAGSAVAAAPQQQGFLESLWDTLFSPAAQNSFSRKLLEAVSPVSLEALSPIDIRSSVSRGASLPGAGSGPVPVTIVGVGPGGGIGGGGFGGIFSTIKNLIDFGFADGTASAPGGMAMVGERGPELMYVPRGAQIIPNHRLGHFADGVGSFATSSFSSSVQANHFHGPMHFHGVQSVDGMMREIALRAKTATPGNSKYAR